MVLATLNPTTSRAASSQPIYAPDRVAADKGSSEAAGWRAEFNAAASKKAGKSTTRRSCGGDDADDDDPLVGGPVGGMDDGEKKPTMRQKRGAPAEAAPDADADADAAPPAKRQQVRQASSGAANGDDGAAAVAFGVGPWALDLDTIQKDAILRQWKETKREKSELQKALDRVQPKKVELEERLRLYDMALDQFLAEVSAIVGEFNNHPPSTASAPSFSSQLLSAEQTTFRRLTTSRFDALKDQLSQILPLIPSTSPEVVNLQNEIARLTATQNELKKALDSLQDEKDELEEKSQEMEYAWGICRTQLAKSQTKVATFLEMQSRGNTKTEKTETKQNGKVNGAVEEPVVSAEAESARQAAVMKAKKLKEQVKSLEAEVASLSKDLTAARAKAASLGDDDYAQTDLFKAAKKRMEDLIANANDLTARCKKAEEDVRRLQEERTAYQKEVEETCRAACEKSEEQLAKLDVDLQRIRSERDVLNQQRAILEGSQAKHDATLRAVQDLNSANEARIVALESEAQRLRLKAGEEEADTSVLDRLADQSAEALKKEAARLMSQSAALNTELSSMQEAVTKFKALATQRVTDLTSLEKEAEKLRETKIRLDASLFSQRSVAEHQKKECELLRRQGAKSAEIITQLKDAENRARELCVNLEKQLAGRADELARATDRGRALAQEASQLRAVAQQHETRAAETGRLLAEREGEALAARHALREKEVELVAAAGALEAAEAEAREWRAKAEGNSTEELTMLRRVAYCTNCNNNLKERAIRTCGHIICQACGDQRIQARDRRCPVCNKGFGSGDLLHVHLV